MEIILRNIYVKNAFLLAYRFIGVSIYVDSSLGVYEYELSLTQGHKCVTPSKNQNEYTSKNLSNIFC